MRRLITLAFGMGLLIAAIATPVSAGTNHLDPLPDGQGWWIAGTDLGDQVDGSGGQATVNANGATVTVHAKGLEPGHAFTMWVVYFNDGLDCTFGESPPMGVTYTNCGLGDLFAGRGGIVYGDGKVIGGSGMATFTGHLKVGDGPDVGPPGVVAYDPGAYPDFHIIVRSHGPKIPGQVAAQTHTVGGGCDGDDVEGEIPDAEGECSDVQLFVFETVPAPVP